MSFPAKRILIPALLALAAWLLPASWAAETAVGEDDPLARLGQQLFFDVSLSRNRTQSCSSCHDPARGFTESRDSGVARAVSLGDDGMSLGVRNAPTLMYAATSPDFHKDSTGLYRGGFFLDGRASTLAMQAGMPILDPTEMAMSSKAEVVARLRDNPQYVQEFVSLFGSTIFNDDDRAYAALQDSIAAYESTSLFAPYDSRYDRYLRGEYKMSAEEELGRMLFVSGLTNCRQCHQLDMHSTNPTDPFTNFQYRNIGIPANPVLDSLSGGNKTSDLGLLQNPDIDDPDMAGRFKVPTLRNVAITGPYMHNGVFKDLKTAIIFYNRYLVISEASMTNPETGAHWDDPEVARNLDLELLRMGQPLDDRQVDAVVAFLRTLTDQRYEHLLNQTTDNRDQRL